ncbi:unnamed protein product [Caenorhabditis nigoni]
MDIGDLIAFSLCSKRTKHLAKSSNRKIHSICAEFDTGSSIAIQQQDDELFFDFDDSGTELKRRNGVEVWRKPEFTQSDWVAHFLSIFNKSMIHVLYIENIEISHLDSIKQIIPKFNRLEIGDLSSDSVAKMAFFKLAPIAVEHVVVHKNVFDYGNDVSKFLTQNLKSVFFFDFDNPFKLELNDLLVAKIENLTIQTANITEQELNRFLKIWMKSNHSFYQPKYIKLFLTKEINRESVLRGIKYHSGNHNCQLTRADDKKLLISIRVRSVIFEFP